MKLLVIVVLVVAAACRSGEQCIASASELGRPEPVAGQHTHEGLGGAGVAGTSLTLNQMLAEAIALNETALAAGGIEMGTVGFHEYPGVPMGSVHSFPVHFAKFDAHGAYVGIEGVLVDVRQHKIMTSGISSSALIPSLTSAGLFDVKVQFNPSIAGFAKQKQLAREAAYTANVAPDDQGIALIRNGFLYSDFTYGEIHAAITRGDGWVTLVTGTSLDEAKAIAAGLRP